MTSSSSPELHHLIAEFFADILHFILDSRSPSAPRPRPDKSSFSFSSRQGNLDPLVVDLVLARHPPDQDPVAKIVERWVVLCEAREGDDIAVDSHSALYKKWSIVLLRSLYLTVRLLPAYKVYRKPLNSSKQVRPFSLLHRVSSFAEPFTRAEDAEMNQFSFAMVDTPCGRLSLSVSYLPELGDMCSESLVPLPTQLIADYVGSPTTDPLKRFTRRHSWSHDHGGTTFLSPSSYSNSHALRCNVNPSTTPHYRRNTSFDENWSSPAFSPSVSPSPPTHFSSGHLTNYLLRLESAPVSIPLSRPAKSNGLLNHGLPPFPSRKVSNPGCSTVRRIQVTTGFDSKTYYPESELRTKKESLRFLKLQTDSSLQKVLSFGKDDVANLSGFCSSTLIPFSRSTNGLTFKDDFEDSEFAYPFAVDDKDLTDSCSRIKPSDAKGNESGMSEYRGLLLARMSSDAAIGALVRMFKAAPSLQRSLSNSVRSMQASIDDTWNEAILHDKNMEVSVRKLDNAASSSETTVSGLFRSKTAADAFVELRHYKEMKEMLLRQVGPQS